MAEKYKETAVVVSQEQIADGIYSMWLQTEQIARGGKAGTIYFRILPQCRKAASTSDQPVRDRPGAGKSENRLSSDRKKYRYRGIQHL